MALPTPSAEYRRILASKKCPRCGAKIISRFNSRVRIFKGDGTEVDMPTKISDVFSFSAFTAIADAYKIAFDKNRDAVAACPECDYRWPVYEGGSKQEEFRFKKFFYFLASITGQLCRLNAHSPERRTVSRPSR